MSHLSEPDARRISTQIVERLRALGGHVTEFGVYLGSEGYTFITVLNGLRVQCRAPQTGLNYQDVATDLMAFVLSPSPETALFPDATL